jgi:transcriptional regulator GlxA family with amidase domain
MPELAGIKELQREARRGVLFSRAVSQEVRPQIETLPGAASSERLLILLRVLSRLAADPQRELLANSSASPAPIAPDARLQKVLDHLHAHFSETVDVNELAELASLSPSALHRMFRRHTRLTPIAYAMKLRIGSACSMLMEGAHSIAAVAAQVGYKNLSNFNRQFRALKGTTPRQFGALHRRKGRVPVTPPYV